MPRQINCHNGLFISSEQIYALTTCPIFAKIFKMANTNKNTNIFFIIITLNILFKYTKKIP